MNAIIKRTNAKKVEVKSINFDTCEKVEEIVIMPCKTKKETNGLISAIQDFYALKGFVTNCKTTDCFAELTINLFKSTNNAFNSFSDTLNYTAVEIGEAH